MNADAEVSGGRSGALAGIRILELGGIGPAPFAGMVLADMGADVIRIDRPVPTTDEFVMGGNVLMRGKRSVQLDLTSSEGREIVNELIARSDAILEGFRPGVLERLGFEPSACWVINPRVSIGRMTGWGQSGPMALAAGHDINYIALAGVLNSIGSASGKPTIPLNLIGDYGGGGLLLAFGILCAVIEANGSGRGQVVDAAMVDGSALLMARWFGEMAFDRWEDGRGNNAVSGASHFYNVYETADEKYLAVGAIEEVFYERLVGVVGLDAAELGDQWDRSRWPSLVERFEAIFRSRTLAQWLVAFEDVDACVSPVLSMNEAIDHEHIRSRDTFVDVDGIVQPAPAPRLDRTPGRAGRLPGPGQHTEEVLRELGVDLSRVDDLVSRGLARRGRAPER